MVRGSAIFTFENTIFSTRVIEGEYLNYRALFSYEHKTKVVVTRRDLINAIERANIIYKAEKGDLVTFSIDDTSILVEGSSEIGDLKDVIDIKKEGDDLKIAFNSKYVLEGLKTCLLYTSLYFWYAKIAYSEQVGVNLHLPKPKSPEIYFL